MAKADPSLDTFDHLVVLMLENRSFDNLVGYLYERDSPALFLPGDDPHFRGVAGRMDLANSDAGSPPRRYPVQKAPFATQRDMCAPYPCPGEVYPNINRQVYGAASVSSDSASLPANAKMSGFVMDYIDLIKQSTGYDGGIAPTPDTIVQIMSCFPPEALPVTSGLARAFAISDAWYSSVPSETFPNRSFIHSGTSLGMVTNDQVRRWVFDTDQVTIFERLSEKFPKGKDWFVYWQSADLASLTRLLHQSLQSPRFDDNFRDYSTFEGDCAIGALPAYSFIEPSFWVMPNDMHPSYGMTTLVDSSVLAGEVLINNVYNAVRRGKSWERTLLVITFDEHGGLYDHVPPPKCAAPPEAQARYPDSEFRFDRFGVRVPTILISPRIVPGTVVRAPGNVPFDHTTIIKTVCARWGLESLTDRDRAAPHVGSVFSLPAEKARRDTPEFTARPYVPIEREATHHFPLTHLKDSIVHALAARAATTLPALSTLGTAVKRLEPFFKRAQP